MIASSAFCMALAIYFEASVESFEGKVAVAYVIRNRMNDRHYSDDACDVVMQGSVDSRGNPVRYRCAFTFYCDGKPEVIDNEVLFLQCLSAARLVLTDGAIDDPTNGSVNYHADYVSPNWSEMQQVATIGTHMFYVRR